MRKSILKYLYLIPTYIIKIIAYIFLRTDVKRLNKTLGELYLFYNNEQNQIVPIILQNHLIIAEDKRFLMHYGIDYIAICNALITNFGSKIKRGASTIEQQLIRVITANYKISYSRKIKEILLASSIINRFSKKEILSMYIFIAYFGKNMYGIKYVYEKLNIDPLRISNREAALIVARLKYPEVLEYNKERIKSINRIAEYILKRHSETTNNNINHTRFSSCFIFDIPRYDNNQFY